MNVYTVVGVSNSGKTGAIKHAMINMIEKEECSVLYASCFRKRDEKYHCDKTRLINYIYTSIEEGLISDRNIKLVLLQYRDKMVGLTTYGDAFGDIYDSYVRGMDVSSKKMDLFVCARHDNNDVEVEFKRMGCIVKQIARTRKKKADKGSDKRIFDQENKKKGKEIFQDIEKLFQ